MEIKTLLNREKILEEKFKAEYERKIKAEFLKSGLEPDIKKVVADLVPKHVKAGLKLGVDWINK